MADGPDHKPLASYLPPPGQKAERCDHCADPLESAYPIALCRRCYLLHSERLHLEALKETTLDLELWRWRKEQPVDSPEADRRFLAAVRQKSGYETLLRHWKEHQAKQKNRRRSGDPET